MSHSNADSFVQRPGVKTLDAAFGPDFAEAGPRERLRVLIGRDPDALDAVRAHFGTRGIVLSEPDLSATLDAEPERRFSPPPEPTGPAGRLAELYVTRRRWGLPALGLAGFAGLVVAGYLFVLGPFDAARNQAARIELSEGLPQRMASVYRTIYDETKVQQAVFQAEALRSAGLAAAAGGDRARAQEALADLIALKEHLQRAYTLRIVNRPGTDTGFWMIPDDATDTTNYYLVVEAVAPDGSILSIPIEHSETGEVEAVTAWGQRVPQRVYESVAADKRDDGIIERDELGRKEAGFLETLFLFPVLEGTVTRW